MTYTLDKAKYAVQAITKVVRVNNTLQFISARHADIPKKVIFTQNLKSVEVYNSLDSYTLLFRQTRIINARLPATRAELQNRFLAQFTESELCEYSF